MDKNAECCSSGKRTPAAEPYIVVLKIALHAAVGCSSAVTTAASLLEPG